MESITVTGFRAVPPFAQGLVRDLRVRWGLREAGRPYGLELIDFAERFTEDYRRKHPLQLVPACDLDGRWQFESGAILHRIAETSEALMPRDTEGRSDTLAWMFAALSTVEPPAAALFALDQLHKDEAWAGQARPSTESTVVMRLEALAAWLDGRDYLIGRFTVADILMTTALRFVRHTDLIARLPVLDAYLRRCEARPAFVAALDEQLAGYREAMPVAA